MKFWSILCSGFLSVGACNVVCADEPTLDEIATKVVQEFKKGQEEQKSKLKKIDSKIKLLIINNRGDALNDQSDLKLLLSERQKILDKQKQDKALYYKLVSLKSDFIPSDIRYQNFRKMRKIMHLYDVGKHLYGEEWEPNISHKEFETTISEYIGNSGKVSNVEASRGDKVKALRFESRSLNKALLVKSGEGESFFTQINNWSDKSAEQRKNTISSRLNLEHNSNRSDKYAR